MIEMNAFSDVAQTNIDKVGEQAFEKIKEKISKVDFLLEERGVRQTFQDKLRSLEGDPELCRFARDEYKLLNNRVSTTIWTVDQISNDIGGLETQFTQVQAEELTRLLQERFDELKEFGAFVKNKIGITGEAPNDRSALSSQFDSENPDKDVILWIRQDYETALDRLKNKVESVSESINQKAGITLPMIDKVPEVEANDLGELKQ